MQHNRTLLSQVGECMWSCRPTSLCKPQASYTVICLQLHLRPVNIETINVPQNTRIRWNLRHEENFKHVHWAKTDGNSFALRWAHSWALCTFCSSSATYLILHSNVLNVIPVLLVTVPRQLKQHKQYLIADLLNLLWCGGFFARSHWFGAVFMASSWLIHSRERNLLLFSSYISHRLRLSKVFIQWFVELLNGNSCPVKCGE